MRRAWAKLLVGPLMGLAIAAIVANIAAFAAWTAPRWSDRLGVIGASSSVAGARQRVEPAMQQMRDTYGRLTSAEESLETFRERLITSLGGSDLLGMLVDAGEAVGIEVDDADFQFALIEELGVVRLAVAVPVSGTYASVRGLLDELFELPVFLVVDGIGLQALGENAGSAPRSQPAGDPILVDLSFSVFFDDQELGGVARGARTPVGPISTAGARAAEILRQAARSEDPDEIAEAIVAQLAALPPLPVDPASLIIDLEALDVRQQISEPTRDLFSFARQAAPPPPPQFVVEDAAEAAPPAPVIPVRLVGVVLIEGRWHASLTDDVEVFVAGAGDRLPNGVQVVEVGADYVELELGDLRTRLTLEGNRE